MDKMIQGKAIVEILDTCDIIITSGKKGIAGMAGMKLGGTLREMGVKRDEAKVLFKMLEQRLFDDSGDDDENDICILLYSGGSDDSDESNDTAHQE